MTHLFASWLIAAKTTDNLRDCRLIALSGVLPDLDGAGLVVDLARQAVKGGDDFLFYQRYHHFLLHGVFGAAVIGAALSCFARRRWRVAALSFLMVHLHFFCDFVGSRGPSPEDLWPILYLAPFSREWVWIWKGQWALDAWPNRMLAVFLFAWCLRLAAKRGDSFVGVFNRQVDHVFVAVLRGWWDKWTDDSKSARPRR